MNKSIIDRLLYKYQKYDLTDCRIDYETIEKIASEFSILQQKVNQLELDVDSYKSKYKRANELYLDICKEVKQLERGKE